MGMAVQGMRLGVGVRWQCHRATGRMQLALGDPVGIGHQRVNAALGPVQRVDPGIGVRVKNRYSMPVRVHQGQAADPSASLRSQHGAGRANAQQHITGQQLRHSRWSRLAWSAPGVPNAYRLRYRAGFRPSPRPSLAGPAAAQGGHLWAGRGLSHTRRPPPAPAG